MIVEIIFGLVGLKIEIVVVTGKVLDEDGVFKMAFKVQGSVNATGNNALELLRKTPPSSISTANNRGSASIRKASKGADYVLNEQQTIGFLFNGYNSHFTWRNNLNINLIGNTQVKSARNRKTGLDEEQGRIKTEH